MSSRVTPELLARYDRPGPRYTSYPTAVEFHEGVTAEDYERCLAEAGKATEEPFSIYVHLPFCDHRCLFCGCHVIVSPHKEKASPYLDLLAREIEMLAARLPERRRFSQLHLGGGTPTYFRPEQLAGFLEHLLQHFQPAANAELAVEVDPRVTSREHLDTLADFGFNRMSMGVQDFSPEVQEAIERIQSVEQTRDLMEHARRRGYRGTNVDLIYGLPHQTVERFGNTLDAVVDLAPDRVAVYSFAFVPWMRAHMKKIGDEDLPGTEAKYALMSLARDRFLDAGYEAIGMDHFARPEDELARARREGRLRRNFQGYTVLPAAEVLGLGISAIGDVGGGYFQNAKKLSDYQQAVSAGRLPVERGVLRTQDDDVRREVIHELMCNFSVDIPRIESRYGLDFADTFREDLHRLGAYAEEGMVAIEPEVIRATGLGEAFIRNLAMCFDRYWREKHENEDRPVFSRTV